jgi:hypothetical protein
MSNKQQEVSILSIDAWADGEDGWNWNMWSKVGSVDVTMCDKPEAEILAYMVAEGYLKEKALTSCYVEDDQYNMVICDKETHEPLFALAYGELQDVPDNQPPPGSWADVARMMAATSDDPSIDWDAWKDQMKEYDLD